MSINFHNDRYRYTYTGREVDSEWKKEVSRMVHVQGKRAVDIGCGGGLYIRTLLSMGADHVTGVDFSQPMLATAREQISLWLSEKEEEDKKEDGKEYKKEETDADKGGNNNSKEGWSRESRASFVCGTAQQTGLEDNAYDLVLQRAVIHHLSAADLQDAFREAFRILKPNGVLIVQDRTPEDCFLPGSSRHIRGYFFELYPELKAVEKKRRHEGHVIRRALMDSGFNKIDETLLWEKRTVYESWGQLEGDLRSRKGRSLLHALDDRKLADLSSYVRTKIQLEDRPMPLIEQDRWTIWWSRK
jgi:ubiquinone/menaquinone biosynthesis C-methylase UbiE